MDSEILTRELTDEQYEDSPYSEDYDLVKRTHLPVARVKKIMKEGEHQGMISCDAPVVLAKACEMLIRDLTLQSWSVTQMTKRCTLQRQDIISAIFRTSIYSFLFDILPPEELKPVMQTHQVVQSQFPRDLHINRLLPCGNVPREFFYPNYRRVKRPVVYSHPYNNYLQLPQLVKQPYMRHPIVPSHMGIVNNQVCNFKHDNDTNDVPLTGSIVHSFSC